MSEDNRFIVVLPASNVLVGVLDVVNHPAGKFALTDAAVIRRWGTTEGLGQLALSGVTADSRLDPVGTAYFDTCLFAIRWVSPSWWH